MFLLISPSLSKSSKLVMLLKFLDGNNFLSSETLSMYPVDRIPMQQLAMKAQLPVATTQQPFECGQLFFNRQKLVSTESLGIPVRI